jgi:hypothetical protein
LQFWQLAIEDLRDRALNDLLEFLGHFLENHSHSLAQKLFRQTSTIRRTLP